MTRIAVVEDNPDLLDDVCFQLRHAGFEVAGVADGMHLADLLPRFAADIVLLDLGLPGEDGLEIAARLRRQRPHMGIVILTARTAVRERIAGHECGADHYLCKPVDAEELLAVVRTLERRLLPTVPDWVLSVQEFTLYAPDGTAIMLTAAEMAVLDAMTRAPQRQISRRELVRALGEDWLSYDERRLEAIVSRLRRKLTEVAGRDAPLRALRGVGYGFLEGLRMR